MQTRNTRPLVSRTTDETKDIPIGTIGTIGTTGSTGTMGIDIVRAQELRPLPPSKPTPWKVGEECLVADDLSFPRRFDALKRAVIIETPSFQNGGMVFVRFLEKEKSRETFCRSMEAIEPYSWSGEKFFQLSQ